MHGPKVSSSTKNAIDCLEEPQWRKRVISSHQFCCLLLFFPNVSQTSRRLNLIRWTTNKCCAVLLEQTWITYTSNQKQLCEADISHPGRAYLIKPLQKYWQHPKCCQWATCKWTRYPGDMKPSSGFNDAGKHVPATSRSLSHGTAFQLYALTWRGWK